MKRWTTAILAGGVALCLLGACEIQSSPALHPPSADCGCGGADAISGAGEAGSPESLVAAGKNAAAAGDRTRSLELLSASVQKASSAGNNVLAADATLALASVMTTENLSREALVPLQQASRLPGISENQREQLQLVLADCQLRAGRPRQATETLNGTFSSIPTGRILAAMIRARVLMQTREFEDASHELAAVRNEALADANIRPEFLLLTAAEQGELAALPGNLDQIPAARATLSTLVIALADDPKGGSIYAVAALRLLAGLGDAADSDLALRLRDLALNRIETARDPGLRSEVFGYSGQVAEAQGQLDDAIEWTRRALLPSSTGLEPGLDMLWNWQLARLFERKGDFAQADVRFRAAFTLASDPGFEESVPPGLPTFCGHERPQDMLRDYADFLLSHGDRVSPSPEVAWREALGIMDSRRELRVQDFLQDRCLASLVGRESTVAAVAPRSAILHILVLADRTEALLEVKDRIFRNVVNVPDGVFYSQVTKFRENLVNPTDNSYREPGKQLYDWLIRPFESQLAGAAVDTLVIATDGELQLIPFGALYDGSGFLIQRMAVASTPSLHLLDAHATQLHNASILGAGLKIPVELNHEVFPALAGVGRELTALQSLPVHPTIMVDLDFTPRNFQQAVADKPYSIVHIVSHAEVGPDPEDFFIVTDKGKIDLDGLDQAVRQTLYRQKPLELLVLSACETAVGDDRVSLGLAGVALKAGARSTLASLWFVNDQSSSAVMTAFYTHWFSKDAPSKAEALRQAQLSLLEDPRYRHPRLWAPYILIGNWQ